MTTSPQNTCTVSNDVTFQFSAEPAPTCEDCKRCLELHGELIKLFRQAINQLVEIQMRPRHPSVAYPYEGTGTPVEPFTNTGKTYWDIY